MATAVVSGRVSEDVKAQAGRVIRKHGLTVGDVIKNVWTEIARTGELPEVARAQETEPAANSDAIDDFLAFIDSLPPADEELINMTDEQMKDLLGSRDV